MNITDLPAIVTGGASGLGEATARLLAARGAKVTIFDLDEARGADIAADFGADFVHVDVADMASVTAGFDAAEAANGVARLLVNCAGIAPAAKTAGKMAPDKLIALYRRTIDINLVGTFTTNAIFADRCAALDDIDGERGVIVNTASIAAFEGQVGQTAYASSKAGVVGLTLPLARDLAARHIRVMGIAPGIFRTPMVAGFPQEVQDALAAQVPHPGRLGQPEEYARLVGAIIDNPMLNGEVIRLDGAVRMSAR